jgi:transcriptional regulator with XRE-family HTH domain
MFVVSHEADEKPLEIGRLIQRQREAIQMSRVEAAKLAEIDADWFREIEEGYASGKGRGPSVRVLERAANAVGLTLTLSRK